VTWREPPTPGSPPPLCGGHPLPLQLPSHREVQDGRDATLNEFFAKTEQDLIGNPISIELTVASHTLLDCPTEGI
jgi:hypothetical protein